MGDERWKTDQAAIDAWASLAKRSQSKMWKELTAHEQLARLIRGYHVLSRLSSEELVGRDDVLESNALEIARRLLNLGDPK